MYFLHKIEFSVFIAIIVCYGVYLTQCGTLTSIKPCKMKLPKSGLYNYVDHYFSGAILLGKISRVHYGNMYHKSCALCYMGGMQSLRQI